MIAIQDLLAALGAVLDGITEAILAMNFGFAMVPTALGFMVGIGGCLAFGSALPISMQAETITMAGTMGKDVRERLSMILYAGLAMTVLGFAGVLNAIVDFAGENIISAMMAGVGIILTKTALDFVKDDRFVAFTSLISGLVIYLFTQDLIYTIVGSVLLSAVAGLLKKGKVDIKDEEKYHFHLYKPVVNFNVIRGSLALMCLTIGANIAYGAIDAAMYNETGNIDALTIYSGLADALSSLFGGGPVEAIISPTAAAPHPLLSAVIMMAVMAVILFSGLLPRIARYVPAPTITGFLFVLGAIVTVPVNAFYAFDGADNAGVLSAGVTVVVTAVSDPFIGLVAGILMRFAAMRFGLVF